LPIECPSDWRSGRTPTFSLTNAEKEDLLQYITYKARFASSLSVSDCQKAICVMKLEKTGLFDSCDSIEAATARLEEHSELPNTKSAWADFKSWVRQTQDRDSWLGVKNLHVRTRPDIACCTISVVQRAMENLENLLMEAKIMNEEKVVIKEEAIRLAVCDEKGLSQRSDSLQRGVVPAALRSRAVGEAPELSWSHITLTSFLTLTGTPPLPVGVVTPTSRTNEEFGNVFPRAIFQANKSGSTTADIFTYFFVECYCKPMRQTVDISKPLILVLDSGGGSFLHLSPRLVAAALGWNIYPYYLPGYTTKALCALDQNCHQDMSAKWQSFKQTLW